MISGSKNNKKKVAILVGGPSLEHEVSLESGENILRNIPADYEARKVIIDKEGRWGVDLEELKREFGTFFIAMHGTFGEDGTIQRILEDAGVAYTGSKSLSSALGMNKFLSLKIFQAGGLNVPPTILFSRLLWLTQKEKVLQKIVLHFKSPWVLKPNMSGSSLGVKITRTKEELENALEFLFKEFKEILVEEFIEGVELSCGVLDLGYPDSAFPLLPTEIIPLERDFFDYKSKYDPSISLEITPARIALPFLKEARKVALLAHKLIGARHFSRTDMILGRDKKIYVLEINTIPGFTKNSLFPKQVETYGLPFSKVLDMILKSV